jgi:hypothetical protein
VRGSPRLSFLESPRHVCFGSLADIAASLIANHVCYALSCSRVPAQRRGRLPVIYCFLAVMLRHIIAVFIATRKPIAQAHKLRLEALERPRLALPLHDWNGADRIRRRTIDYLRTDSEVDERVPRFIHQAINTSCLEKNACFLTKHLFIFT